MNYVVTDLALLHWQDGRFVLKEVAPGFSAREVLDLTEMEIAAGPDVRTMDGHVADPAGPGGLQSREREREGDALGERGRG